MALSHLSHDQESKTQKYAGCDDTKQKKSSKSSQWRRRDQRIVGICKENYDLLISCRFIFCQLTYWFSSKYISHSFTDQLTPLK